MAKILNFTGTALHQKPIPFPDSRGIKRELHSYRPSKELVKSVQLAFQVGRPLLIMGEPGTGKTRLAEAVAYELHGKKMYDHFFTWNVKSTSKAQDGIYQFNYLKQMYDANVKEDLPDDDAEKEKRYIQYGALADTFQTPLNKDENGNALPNILLIDEIDKADIDFPNDLLLELDKKKFSIAELKNKIIEVEDKHDILIFITSNEEKELPAAFLRRCLFHYIQFPNGKELEHIVLSHFMDMEKEYPFFEKALEKFVELRGQVDGKKPSTSELIDWFGMIEHYNKRRNAKDLSSLEKEMIGELENFEDSKEDENKIPYSQLLFKTLESLLKTM